QWSQPRTQIHVPHLPLAAWARRQRPAWVRGVNRLGLTLIRTLRREVARLLQWRPKLRVWIQFPRPRLPRFPWLSKQSVFGCVARCDGCVSWLCGRMQPLNRGMVKVWHGLDEYCRRTTNCLTQLWNFAADRNLPPHVALAVQVLRRGDVRAFFEQLRDTAN